MDDDDEENLDWINCPHCGDILYYPEGLFWWPEVMFFFRRKLSRHFFCVRCCDFIDSREIVGREFNGVNVGGGDGYWTWRASNEDGTIFAGKLKDIEPETDEWRIFLKALGIDPDKLGTNLNLEIEEDNRPFVIGNEVQSDEIEEIKSLVNRLEQLRGGSRRIVSGGTSTLRTKDGKKIVYIDMDSVLVDFEHALIERGLDPDMDDADEIGGLFSEMIPIEGAQQAFKTLRGMDKFDVYILSSGTWNNPSAWYDKLQWVKRYLGEDAKKRLILSHHKDLNWGSYLIDDRPNNGAREFGEVEGQTWIKFGSDRFPDWKSVLEFLQQEE